MPNQNFNPIQTVKGIAVRCPSKYDWKESDVSSADAGRTEDGKMHKKLITKKVHLELEWQNVFDADAATILTAFDDEYVNVNYYDYKAAAFQTKRFYVGDRQVTTYSRNPGMSTIAFNIIEQ